MLATSQDTLFYDGQCPLCSREIRHLKKFSKNTLQFQDIHAIETTMEHPSDGQLPDQLTLLKTLHLQKSNGAWLTGLDANIAAWKHTQFRWLARLLELPLISNIGNRVYNHWAVLRFKKLYQNKDQVQTCPCGTSQSDA